MNKAMRMLVMAGTAVAAGATFGAGPASAATASTAPHATQTRVVGYFHSLSACHHAGNVGESRNSWDGHTCLKVRGGFHRGQWALAVAGRPHFPGHVAGHGPIHHGPVMGHGPVHHSPVHHSPVHHGSHN